MNRLLTLEETGAYLPLVMHGYSPPRLSVTLDPSVAVRNGAPGDVVAFPLTLKNSGNIPDSFHVTLTTTGEPE